MSFKKSLAAIGSVLLFAILISILPAGCNKIDDPMSRPAAKTPLEQAKESGESPVGAVVQ